MKTFIAVLLFIVSGSAVANACGYPPIPPYGMKIVCFCDQNGKNCQFIAVPK